MASMLSRILGRPETRDAAPVVPALSFTEGWGAFTQSAEAGEIVTTQSALTISTLWTCVSYIAKIVSSLPVIVSLRTDKGKVPLPWDDPLQHLLSVSPNEQMSAPAFWMAFVLDMLVEGTGVAEIQRDSVGNVIALWPLRARDVQPERLQNGDLVFRVSVNSATRQLGPESILNVPWQSFDGVWGTPVAERARTLIGLALALERFGARFFANYATPSLALKIDAAVPAEQKAEIREAWERNQTGRNTHRLAVLDQGMDIEQLSVNPSDAEFSALMSQTRARIAALYSLPLHVVGDPSFASRASVEEQNKAMWGDAIAPITKLISAVLATKVLPHDYGRASDYVVEFSPQALLSGDTKTMTEKTKNLVNSGVLKINEARNLQGLSSIGDQGEDILLPSNFSILKPDGQIVQLAQRPGDTLPTPTEEGSTDTN